jgi:hypothetical protein
MTKIEQLMTQVNGSTFITINTETPVKLTGGQKNPLQGRVTKRVVGSNVMVFQNKTTNAYENMVNKRLVQEGFEPKSFSVGPRTWGTRRKDSPFIDHDDNVYLEVIFLKSGDVEYLVDGQKFEGHIEGLPQSRSEGQQGGLENKVIIRTYNINSIKSITINKQHYIL